MNNTKQNEEKVMNTFTDIFREERSELQRQLDIKTKALNKAAQGMLSIADTLALLEVTRKHVALLKLVNDAYESTIA